MKLTYHPPEYGIDLRSPQNTGPARSSGVHLSGIIQALAIKHGILDEPGDSELSLDDLIASLDPVSACRHPVIMRLVLGFMWEHWYAKQIPGLIHQPGQCSLDGVLMTPDGILYDNRGLLLHEFKATRKSSRKPITDWIMLLWQIMGYLAGLSAKFNEQCTRAVVHPLHIDGDYSVFPRSSIYAPVMIEFTWAEITANWELMLASKHLAKEENHNKEQQ